MICIARDSRRELEKMACRENRLVGNGVISFYSSPPLSISFLFFLFFTRKKERDSFEGEGGMVLLT